MSSKRRKARVAPRTAPKIAKTVPILRQAVAKFRRAGDSVALVPTMGALHAGHLALVKLAHRKARRVVVSIFVNPAQFAPNEDFAAYPRSFEADVAALTGTGADVVWAPAPATMYPPGFATRIVPAGPAVVGLEDAFRPHFFAGVATVVTKLLIQCTPDVAIFGEKDFQQLEVITALARDLDLPVKVIGAPIVREEDGLAMSSRNVNLTAGERQAAPVLYRTLKASAERIAKGELVARVLDEGGAAIERAGFTLDYFEARHAETLAKIEAVKDVPIRLLVAARIGQTRLIDNLAV